MVLKQGIKITLSENIISLGQINFIEHLPINYPFEIWHNQRLKLTSAYPEMINNLFLDRQLHVAPVSSTTYIDNIEKLSLIESICISSGENSKRAVLFSKHPIEDLWGKKILLPYTSASSCTLVKILLYENGIDINTVNFEKHKYTKTPEEFLLNNDAVLFTGNNSIFCSPTQNEQIYVYDLSSEWKKITQLPFVFTTWVSWKAWSNSRYDDFEWLSFILSKAVEAGLGIYFNEIVEIAFKKFKINKRPIPKAEFSEILKTKNIYTFGPEQKESLLIFQEKYQKLIKDIS